MSNFINCADGDETSSRPPTYATRSSTSEIPSIFHQFLRCSDDKVDVAGLIGRDTSAAPDDDCGLTLVQVGCSMVQHASVMAPIGGGQGGHEPTLHQFNPAEVPSLIKRGWPQANGQLPVTKTCTHILLLCQQQSSFSTN